MRSPVITNRVELNNRPRLLRTILCFLLAAIFLLAGIIHIKAPGGFLQITPAWVPFPEQMIFLTGVAEILGAIGLMIPRKILGWSRPAAGIGLALYAICVFPANINHAINDIAIGGNDLSWWYHGPRLLFQPVIVWAALFAGEVIRWPFKAPQQRLGSTK